ncbi:MAG: hypothetical protein U1G05_02840 [Kiritimatiellia bacterium]
MKRLVIELELDHVVIFLVHLALSFRVRHGARLDRSSSATQKPLLVAGDFNATLGGGGDRPVPLAATDLRNANPMTNPPSSWAPGTTWTSSCLPRHPVGRFEVPKVPIPTIFPWCAVSGVTPPGAGTSGRDPYQGIPDSC